MNIHPPNQSIDYTSSVSSWLVKRLFSLHLFVILLSRFFAILWLLFDNCVIIKSVKYFDCLSMHFLLNPLLKPRKFDSFLLGFLIKLVRAYCVNLAHLWEVQFICQHQHLKEFFLCFFSSVLGWWSDNPYLYVIRILSFWDILNNISEVSSIYIFCWWSILHLELLLLLLLFFYFFLLFFFQLFNL